MTVIEMFPLQTQAQQQLQATTKPSGHSRTSSEASFIASVASDLLDGDLGADELNEIPELPPMSHHDESAGDAANDPTSLSSMKSSSYHFESDLAFGGGDSTSHLATNIALAASAIDGTFGGFGMFLPSSDKIESSALAGLDVADAPLDLLLTGPSSVAAAPLFAAPVDEKKRKSPVKKEAAATKKRRVTTGVISPDGSVASSQIVNHHADETMLTAMPPLPSLSTSTNVNNNTEEAAVAKPSTSTTTTQPNPSGWSEASELSGSEDLLSGEVNLDTDHIRMLLSEHGPAECAKAIVSNFATDGRTRNNRQHLSQEERTKASRDRNREHARNTRRRKKVYVDELKRTLSALVVQRDQEAEQAERQVQVVRQQRNVRYSVLQEFLTMRGNNSTDVDRWNLILVEQFQMRLPAIIRSDEVVEKMLVGVDQTMADAQAFFNFLQSIRGSNNGSANDDATIALAYDTDQSNFFMDGTEAVQEWTATTVGACQEELKFHGNVKASFDPDSNKLVSIKMVFDTGALLSQKKMLANAANY